MPFKSRAQQRWAYSDAGKQAGFTSGRLEKWSAKTDFKHLPARKKKRGKNASRQAGLLASLK